MKLVAVALAFLAFGCVEGVNLDADPVVVEPAACDDAACERDCVVIGSDRGECHPWHDGEIHCVCS